MLEGGIAYPEHLEPEHLDYLLARGWYRMGSGVFTCRFIEMDGILHQVHWLRYCLRCLAPRRTHARVFRRNEDLNVSVAPLVVTDEMEEVFRRYKRAVDFDPGPSVRECLLEEGKPRPFNSQMILVRHSSKLIAAGIFDLGGISAAGIVNFYDPEHKNRSLGKLLLLLKLDWCIGLGKTWFYPGYVVSQLPRFDYKLFPGEAASEIYLPETGQWIPYDREYVESSMGY